MIAGFDKRDSVLKIDTNLCPNCEKSAEYKLKRTSFYFTWFWIPLLPLGVFETYVECCNCRSRYIPINLKQQSIYPDYNPESDLYIAASLNRRMFAFLFDAIILILLNVGWTFLADSYTDLLVWLPDNIIVRLVTLGIIYFSVSEILTGGYTLGKRIFSVRTTLYDRYQPINCYNAFIRALTKSVLIIAPIIFAVAYFVKGHRAIHDLASGSIVVSKEKK